MEKNQYSPTLHAQVRATVKQYGDIGKIISLVTQEIRAQVATNTQDFPEFVSYTKIKLDQLEALGEESTEALETLFRKRHYIFKWTDYLG